MRYRTFCMRIFFTCFLLVFIPLKSSPQTLVINEIMASNASTIADEDGDYEDWIELYNFGTEAIELEGYGLSDDYDNPYRWVFPEVTINPGEYILVWASGKDRRPADGAFSNGLVREVYTGIPGWSVDDLINHPSYPDHPCSRNIVSNYFEAPINIGDHYGQRIMGWIKAPVSGHYIFWISSDDNSRLYLSSTENPEDLEMIAHVPGWTHPREWDKYSQQQSDPVFLHAGDYYFIKALMKEHEGGDNLAVGWQMPGGNLQKPITGTYLFNDQGELHTNFRISSSGEEVLITDPNGVMIDEITPTVIPTDISYGRYPNGTGELFFFNEPTPGESNSPETFNEIMDPPTFSIPGGFYASPFNLVITHPDPEATIIYTLDGSEPDADNLDGTSYQYKNSYPQNPWNPFGPFISNYYYSYIYTEPIAINDRSGEPDKLTQISSTWHANPQYFPNTPVRKGVSVRAIAVKENALPAKAKSHTYFVSATGKIDYSLPVVSINIQENYFFDYNDGIYVAGVDFDNWREANNWAIANGGSPGNYWRRGGEWEYPAHMEIFAPGNSKADLRQDIGVRIHGGWSRAFPNKSLRLYARNRFGEQYFNYPIFPESIFNSFNRLILRNSGNDTGHTLFRDAAIQQIVDGLDFDTQDYQPAIVFINGEYWGIHNFRERYDKHYLARVYGVDGENIDLLDGNANIKEGNSEHYIAMRSYLADNDMSQPQHYEYIQTQMDISNFIDYNIAQIYSRNTDWPGNNIDFWRLRTYEYLPNAPTGHDGRWRWMLYDTDFGFGFMGGTNAFTHNTLEFATDPDGPGWPNPPWSTLLLRRLLVNPEFQTGFINRFADLLNTYFQPSRVVAIIEEMKQAIQPEIEEHIIRWSAPGSMSSWNNNVNVMTNFANQRPHYQRNHIRQYFSIPSNIDVNLDVQHNNHGYIRINTVKVVSDTPGVPEEPYPWSGIYFYGIPIEIEAIANPGYAFSHWEGNTTSTESILQIIPESTVSLTAHFVESEVIEPEVVHYWHFNNLPSGTLSSVNTDYSATEVETGTISYPGSGGGYMDRRTHREDDPVSNLNLLMGEQPDQGAVLRARNPADVRELQFQTPTTGFENISVSFATTRTTNGATAQKFYYSVDGGTSWDIAGQAYIVNLLPIWELISYDLSDVPEVNNNESLKFRILFTGENTDGSSGNNRFDNFSVHGFPVDDEVSIPGIRQKVETGHQWSDHIKIYPNPAGDLLLVEFFSTGETTLRLINLQGQVIELQSVNQQGIHQLTFETHHLSAGVYILRINHANDIFTERIVVE